MVMGRVISCWSGAIFAGSMISTWKPLRRTNWGARFFGKSHGHDGAVVDDCGADTCDGRQAVVNLDPGLAFILRTEELSTARSKVKSCRIVGVGGHGVAQDGFVGLLLGKAAAERFPRGASVAGAIDAEAAVARAAEFFGLDGHDVGAIGIVRVYEDGKSEIGGHAVGDVNPILGAVVGAIDSAMILQKQALRTG